MLNVLLWIALLFCTLSNAYLLMQERKQGKPITARAFSLFFCVIIIVLSILDNWKV